MLLIARSYVGGNVFLSSKLLLWGNLLRTISSFSHSLFRFLTHSNSLSLSLSLSLTLSLIWEKFLRIGRTKSKAESWWKRGRGSVGGARGAWQSVRACTWVGRSKATVRQSTWKAFTDQTKNNNNTVDSSPSFPHPSSANVQLRLEQHCSDLAGNILKLLNCRQAWIPGCHSDQSLRQRFCAMQHEYTWASLGLTDAR